MAIEPIVEINPARDKERYHKKKHEDRHFHKKPPSIDTNNQHRAKISDPSGFGRIFSSH